MVTDTRIKVVVGMLFFTLSSADIQFAKKELVWKTYNTVKALLIIQRMKIINKKKFMAAVLNEEDKTCGIYIAAFTVNFNIHVS